LIIIILDWVYKREFYVFIIRHTYNKHDLPGNRQFYMIKSDIEFLELDTHYEDLF